MDLAAKARIGPYVIARVIGLRSVERVAAATRPIPADTASMQLVLTVIPASSAVAVLAVAEMCRPPSPSSPSTASDACRLEA